RRLVEALDLHPAITAALIDPERVLDAGAWLGSPGLARVIHACTHTTLSPNVVRGGTNVNVIPDRVAIDVDVRMLPGVTAADVDAMLADALGDLADRVEISAPQLGEGSISPMETPLYDALARTAAALLPGSRLVPQLAPGATDARHFRGRGVPAYGFGLHSPRIPYTEYPLMFTATTSASTSRACDCPACCGSSWRATSWPEVRGGLRCAAASPVPRSPRGSIVWRPTPRYD